MRRTALFGSGLLLAFGAVGCQDQVTEPGPPTVTVGDLVTPGQMSAVVSDLDVSLPTGLDRDGARTRLLETGLTESHFANAVDRAINPGEFQCPPSTAVIDFFLDEFFEFVFGEPDLFNLLFFGLLADLIPQFEALLLQDGSLPQEFGYDGQFTQVMRKTDRDVRRFWDINSDDILLLAMKGTMLQDPERVSLTYQVAFGESEATADFFASLILDALSESEILDGGNHVLFSFNAFAFSNPGSGISDRIVMGDAILEAYEALGFGDVAPQAIYSHEFAHHIQFENDYFSDPIPTTDPGGPNAAEATRYTELMADAMSAYYLTHARGGTLRQRRVEQFLEVFFELGDCGFSDPGHHGTPAQRMRAAQFGFRVADLAQKQGHILSSQEFHDLFVANYLDLVAPDAF
ncbi:MAG: hypothetical protein OEM96_00045 [Gemmatimonadota bacterium]|nr:hypothetical protein [Gemmatimonadota bacterium]